MNSLKRKAFALASAKAGYNIALDHLIPALASLKRGNTKTAARWLSQAVKAPDFKTLISKLELGNQKAYARTRLVYPKVLSKLIKANDPEILDVQYDLHGVPERLNLVEKGPGIFDHGEYDGEEECIAPDDRTGEWMISEDEDRDDVDDVEYKDDMGDNTEAGVSAGLPDEGDTHKDLFENEELLCEFEEQEMVDSPSNRDMIDLNEAAGSRLKARVQSNLEAIAEVSDSKEPKLPSGISTNHFKWLASILAKNLAEMNPKISAATAKIIFTNVANDLEGDFERFKKNVWLTFVVRIYKQGVNLKNKE